MNKIIEIRKIALLISIAFLASSASASVVEQQSTPSGIKYIAGGVSEEQSQQFDAMRTNFNTQFTFAEQGTGAYLADIPIEIKNLKDEVMFSIIVPGPFLYVNLPDGNYIAHIRDNEKIQNYKFKVYSGNKTIHVFYFKQE